MAASASSPMVRSVVATRSSISFWPQTRGRGWSRVLLEGLEEYARSWGAAELVLDTHHTLEAAGALYARSGFTSIEPYNDNPNASRWYGKPLD